MNIVFGWFYYSYYKSNIYRLRKTYQRFNARHWVKLVWREMEATSQHHFRRLSVHSIISFYMIFLYGNKFLSNSCYGMVRWWRWFSVGVACCLHILVLYGYVLDITDAKKNRSIELKRIYEIKILCTIVMIKLRVFMQVKTN